MINKPILEVKHHNEPPDAHFFERSGIIYLIS
jgi:hypothetical protein